MRRIVSVHLDIGEFCYYATTAPDPGAFIEQFTRGLITGEGHPLAERLLAEAREFQEKRAAWGAKGGAKRWGSPKEVKRRIVKPTGKETWLTPYVEVWREVMGGEMSCEKFAKDLKKAEASIGPQECVKRWRSYLTSAGQFANAAQFQSKLNLWGGKAAPATPREHKKL